MTPTLQAAALVRRYLAANGRRHTFRPEDDLEPFRKWLHNIDATGDWRRCRGLAGLVTDLALLVTIAQELPALVAVERSSTVVLLEHIPGMIMFAEPARPTTAELARCRLVGVNLINAVLRGDFARVLELAPATAADGGFLALAVAELAVELITASGRDPAEVIDEMRGQTVQDQDIGGRRASGASRADRDRVAGDAPAGGRP